MPHLSVRDSENAYQSDLEDNDRIQELLDAQAEAEQEQLDADREAFMNDPYIIQRALASLAAVSNKPNPSLSIAGQVDANTVAISMKKQKLLSGMYEDYMSEDDCSLGRQLRLIIDAEIKEELNQI